MTLHAVFNIDPDVVTIQRGNDSPSNMTELDVEVKEGFWICRYYGVELMTILSWYEDIHKAGSDFRAKEKDPELYAQILVYATNSYVEAIDKAVCPGCPGYGVSIKY